MSTQIIRDRGRGPEIQGSRVTLFTLLPDFLDPEITEADIPRRYDSNATEVAAARADIMDNMEAVGSKSLAIEARITGENPPEVIETARATRAKLLEFKTWLARQETRAERSVRNGDQERDRIDGQKFPTFTQWLAGRGSRTSEGP